jgi:hypothetical protein
MTDATKVGATSATTGNRPGQAATATIIDGRTISIRPLKGGADDQATAFDSRTSTPASTPPRYSTFGARLGRAGTTGSRPASPRAWPEDATPTLHSRVRPRRPELEVKDGRTWPNIGARWVVGGLLALGGAVGGFLGGSAVGTFLGGPVGAAIGGGLGAFALGSAGWKAGTRLADSCFLQPQAAHLDKALTELEISRRGFAKTERQSMEAVTDQQWRDLLHLPSSKGRYMPFKGSGAGARVRDPKRRQKIRQALALRVAVTGKPVDVSRRLGGQVLDLKKKRKDRQSVQRAQKLEDAQQLDEAWKLKETLVTAANDPDDPTMLDRLIAEDRLKTICKDLSLPDPWEAGSGLTAEERDRCVDQLSKGVREQDVSAWLVEHAADQAAGDRTNGEAHARAVCAIVAHQGRYAKSPQAFMQGDYPGSASLAKILGHYNGDYLRDTINPIRSTLETRRPATLDVSSARWEAASTGGRTDQQIRQRGRQAIANLGDTMGRIVGGDAGRRLRARAVPPGLRTLVVLMADAASQHERAGEHLERRALFHGLIGDSLAPRPGRRGADNLAQNEALVRQSFLDVPEDPRDMPDDPREDDSPQTLPRFHATSSAIRYLMQGGATETDNETTTDESETDTDDAGTPTSPVQQALTEAKAGIRKAQHEWQADISTFLTELRKPERR